LIPHTAYTGDLKWGLLPDGVNTIYHDYRPGVIFRVEPEVLASIDPAWRYCRNYQFMAFDPPLALTPTALRVLAQPSLRPNPPDNAAPYPGATQAAPYPMKTPETTPELSPTFSDINGSPNLLPNVVSGVTVSRARPVTIQATPALAEAASEWAGTPGMGGLDGNRQALEAGYQAADRNPSARGTGPQQAVFTVSGQAFTATVVPSRGFVIGDSTVLAGGNPITVHGVAVSAFNGGVVVGAGPETSLHNTDALSSSGLFHGGDAATTLSDPAVSTTSKRKKNRAESISFPMGSWFAVLAFWLSWEIILLIL